MKLLTIIRQKELEKKDLRNTLKCMTDTGVICTGSCRDGIHTDSAYAVRLTKLISLEEEIDAMMDEYISLRHKIISQIHNLSSVNQIKVLYRRYVRFEKFEQIAADLNFSVRNVYVIHGQALREFQKIYMQKIK